MISRFFLHKHGIAFFLFFIPMIFLGFLYTKWGFYGDDYLNLYYATKTHCIENIIKGDPNIYNITSPIDYGQKETFFSVLYRPIQCACMVVMHALFGDYGYPYLLVNTFFHAINTVLLFYLLLLFCCVGGSLLGALFFAFHPQIGFHFGHMANIQYYGNVTLFLLIFFLLKKYSDSRCYSYMFVSWFLYLLSIFWRETGLALTLIIPTGLYVYAWYKQKKYHLKDFIRCHGACILGFWVTTFAYLVIRALLYPILFSPILGGSFFEKITKGITDRFASVIMFGYDFFWMSWLPHGHILFKALLVGILLISSCVLFLKNTHKILLIFLATVICLLLWPSLYLNYMPRYFYEVSPCVVLFFTCLITCRSQQWGKRACWFGRVIGILFVSFLMGMCYTNIRCREQKMVIRDNAIREFVARPDIKNKPLWLLTYPEDGFFPGMAHAIWYYSSRAQPDSHESLIMTDSFTWLSDIKSMGFYGFVSDHGWFHCAPYTTKNDYVVTRYRNTIRLTSLDTKKWGFSSPYKKLNTPLGRKTIHRTTSIKNGHKVNSDISIEIDDQWISRDPAFVIWDFEQQKFCLIKPTE